MGVVSHEKPHRVEVSADKLSFVNISTVGCRRNQIPSLLRAPGRVIILQLSTTPFIFIVQRSAREGVVTSRGSSLRSPFLEVVVWV